MFGVMKNRSCSQSDEQKYEYRLHYCGTCKTMGTLFGQASRFLLNNDAVFLAELLTAITPAKADISSWKKEYQSFNCFALPSDPLELPLSLTIAANVTMVLTEFKLADHIIDSEKKHWKTVRNLFSKKFDQASTALESMSFPMDELWRWFEEQLEHERLSTEYAETHFPRQLIDYCAKPTAHMTAIVFESGARAVGCSDQAVLVAMRKLGLAFGKLVYVLDAFEDFAKDMRRKEFNPFAVAYKVESAILPEHCRQDIYPYVQSLSRIIEDAMDNLSIDPALQQQFRARLRQNITDKLGTDWQEFIRAACTAHAHSCSSAAKQSARACSNARLNFQQKREAALEISQRLRSDSNSVSDALINICLFPLSFLFPYHARQAKSKEQMFGLLFNLIAWGALFNDLFSLAPQKLNYAFAMSAGSGGGVSSGDDGASGGGAGSSGGNAPKKWGGRRRKFGQKEPSEPLPDLVETPEQNLSQDLKTNQGGGIISDPNAGPSSDLNTDPNADPNASKESRPEDLYNSPQNFSRRRPRPGVPYQSYPQNFYRDQMLANCGCNLCANCACNCCEGLECLGDCTECFSCGSEGCGGCCGAADCCSGAECAGVGDCCTGCGDCAGGCGDCADCAGGCGDCAGGCGDCSC